MCGSWFGKEFITQSQWLLFEYPASMSITYVPVNPSAEKVVTRESHWLLRNWSSQYVNLKFNECVHCQRLKWKLLKSRLKVAAKGSYNDIVKEA